MNGFGAIERGKTGWLENRIFPSRNPDEVLIKTTAIAMCTSDVHMVEEVTVIEMMPKLMGNQKRPVAMSINTFQALM